MPSRQLDFPVFDADNHMYETHGRAHQVPPGRVRGRHRLRRGPGPHEDRREGPDQRLHPQPHLRAGGRAGRAGGVLQGRQPGGQDPPGDHGQGHRRPRPRFREPGAPPRADGRARPRPGPHVADARQPRRGAPARRPRRHPRRRSTPSTSGCTRLDVQLRGPHLPHARSSRCRSSRRRSRSSSGCIERGAKIILVRPAPVPGLPRPALVRPAGVRPVLGARAGDGHRRRHARLRQRLPALPQRVGGRPRRRVHAVHRRLAASPPSSATPATGRSSTRSPRPSATACARGSRG